MLSEVAQAHAQALLSLAALALGLGEAELRVAVYLALIADPLDHTSKASSRRIAEATRLGRRAVQRAVDSLTRRCLVTTRQGTATKPSGYLLNFTQTVALAPGVAGTPPVRTSCPRRYIDRIDSDSRSTAHGQADGLSEKRTQ